MKKTTLHIILAAAAGVVVFVFILMAMNIPARIAAGNQAQHAIQMLDSMRPPMLAFEKTEGEMPLSNQMTTFELLAQTLQDKVATYLDASKYNPTLHERVTTFANSVDNWLVSEKKLWQLRLTLNDNVSDLNTLKKYSQQHDVSINLFLRALDTLALGEQPVHHDIDEGRHANLALQISSVALLVYLLILIIIFQRRSNQKLRSSYQQIQATQRKLAEREEHLSRTLNSIGDAVIATDAQGMISRMNPIAEQLTGWTSTEAVGQPLKTVFHIVNAFSREAVENPVAKVLASGQIVGLANHTVLISKDGTEYQIADSGAPIYDDHDNIMGVILVFRDVTEEYRLQEEIRTSRDQLEQRVVERTKELESFSYAVSHDLRAPLRSIHGFSQVLQDDYCAQLDDDGKDFLQRICNATLHMSELIDAMLTLSQITRKDIQNTFVNLSQIAEDISKELQERDSSQSIEWSITDKLHSTGDAKLLKIALENLLNNAWKYSTKNNERIHIEFSCTEKDGKPVFFIRDNGCGFDARYADKLFAPFQRLHGQEYEGTGIGLATVQRIIDRHQGKIWAESEPGKGSTFYFTLA